MTSPQWTPITSTCTIYTTERGFVALKRATFPSGRAGGEGGRGHRRGKVLPTPTHGHRRDPDSSQVDRSQASSAHRTAR